MKTCAHGTEWDTEWKQGNYAGDTTEEKRVDRGADETAPDV